MEGGLPYAMGLGGTRNWEWVWLVVDSPGKLHLRITYFIQLLKSARVVCVAGGARFDCGCRAADLDRDLVLHQRLQKHMGAEYTVKGVVQSIFRQL